MILKTLLLPPLLRFGLPAVLSLARASRAAESLPGIGGGARSLLFVVVGLYQRFFPHAPDPMYVNEVRFYTEVRPEIDLEAPQVFGGLYDQASRRFGILIEDLTLRGARFANATGELALDSLRDGLANLARLHARFWKSPRFDGIGRELIRYQVEQYAPKAECLRRLGRSVDQLWDDLWASQRRLAAGPLTLLHGDTPLGNTYVLPDGSAGLLDFQLSVRGHWANDVGYLLATALAAESRRQHERELIGFYLDQLRRNGVAEAPDADEAWDCYRLAMVWGLAIGWLITPAVNYGPAITDANLSRMVGACQDLDPFSLLC
jgi:hypothetical protein